jgi:hypothetical protein
VRTSPNVSRNLAEIFQELPSKDDYPDYYDLIEDPIALDVIQVLLTPNTVKN